MTVKYGSPMWFYPGAGASRLPAMVDKVWSSTIVGLVVDEGPNMVTPRNSVPVWDGVSPSPTGIYCMVPEADDNVDLDMLKAHRSPPRDAEQPQSPDDDTA